jgi:hypothetical protein
MMDYHTLCAVRAMRAYYKAPGTSANPQEPFDAWLDQAIDATPPAPRAFGLMAGSFGCGVLVMLPALAWAWL